MAGVQKQKKGRETRARRFMALSINHGRARTLHVPKRLQAWARQGMHTRAHRCAHGGALLAILARDGALVARVGGRSLPARLRKRATSQSQEVMRSQGWRARF